MENRQINDRRLRTTHHLRVSDWDKNIRACPKSGHFFINSFILDGEPLSQNYPVIFINGSCLNNGRTNPRVGTGVVAGIFASQQASQPLSNICRIPGRRTSERAELFGTIEGVSVGMELLRSWLDDLPFGSGATKTSVVIATDSKNVVDGLTEWLPRWEANEYSTSSGGPVMNIRLFQCLQKRIVECEEENYIDIVFLHIPHEVNRLACGLSNSAAKMDVPGSFRGVAVEEEKRKTKHAV
ncbi:ribonuclease H-like domain-containing protein [Phyllosticta citriasiana]|uniref:ribonuclease H-like domain-containing protein n=1 Tax=Phyllosticta citriasiana TaxID=595635 RepID=UPI0030FD5A54